MAVSSGSSHYTDCELHTEVRGLCQLQRENSQGLSFEGRLAMGLITMIIVLKTVV